MIIYISRVILSTQNYLVNLSLSLSLTFLYQGMACIVNGRATDKLAESQSQPVGLGLVLFKAKYTRKLEEKERDKAKKKQVKSSKELMADKHKKIHSPLPLYHIMAIV